jgi:hypothetical protein
MSLIHSFHSQRHNFFDILYMANIVLVPRRREATQSAISVPSVSFMPWQR